jgi:ABC-type multidrug transport system ATPase subunit
MSSLLVQSLSKSYGKIPALRELSLEVSEGEIFALVGPDGAGKTTCIRILCGVLDPDAGEATIGGFSVLKEFARIKPLLGYMPQVFSLYPDLSVEENLTFYAGIYGLTGSEYRAKRDALYDFSQLGPFADRRAAALSGGMKQKLALSCALIHDPKILILDEPTTGVDPLSRRQFWEILLELRRRGTTILVSTPYMDEVAHADRACFIFNGQKLSQGTPDELAAQFEGTVYFLDRTPSTKLVEQLNSIPGIQARRFGAGMHIYLQPGHQIEQYNGPLAAAGIETGHLMRISPELEDRFIQLMEVRQ